MGIPKACWIHSGFLLVLWKKKIWECRSHRTGQPAVSDSVIDVGFRWAKLVVPSYTLLRQEQMKPLRPEKDGAVMLRGSAF